MQPIKRIHHLSATVGDPNENLGFYRDVLGLRLVKQTVNFEDNGTYHLYFSNKTVDAGSILTFFPRLDNLNGRTGAGQVGRIAFSVPQGTLSKWGGRLTQKGISYEKQILFQKQAMLFNDPHGLHLALVESKEKRPDEDILGFYGVELLSEHPEQTVQLLTDEMGLQLHEKTDQYYHLEMVGSENHQVLIHRKRTERGRLGIGTVHHIAWSVSDEDELVDWKAAIGNKRKVTAIHDRKYFHSAYFRDPGRIIYELATEGPGFTVDEPLDTLGSKLMLPKQYEAERVEIEARLPKLNL